MAVAVNFVLSPVGEANSTTANPLAEFETPLRGKEKEGKKMKERAENGRKTLP